MLEHLPIIMYLLQYFVKLFLKSDTSTSNYITVSRVIWLGDGKLCLKQRRDNMMKKGWFIVLLTSVNSSAMCMAV